MSERQMSERQMRDGGWVVMNDTHTNTIANTSVASRVNWITLRTIVLAASAHCVGRHITLVALTKGSNKLAGSRQRRWVEHALEIPRSKALVVTRDQRVGVVHAGAMNSEPVEQTDRIAVGIIEAQQRHVLIGVVGIVVGIGVVRVRVRRAAISSTMMSQAGSERERECVCVCERESGSEKDTMCNVLGRGIQQSTILDFDVGRLQTSIGKNDRLGKTVDNGIEILLDETERSHIVERFSSCNVGCIQ
jgi:hypothetical protein